MDTKCIEWAGSKDVKGYGKLRIEGKQRYAHRVIYEREVGKIPEGLVIDHLCRNTSCVNPLHLEPCTIYENIQRGVSYLKERGLYKGHSKLKLTPEERIAAYERKKIRNREY